VAVFREDKPHCGWVRLRQDHQTYLWLIDGLLTLVDRLKEEEEEKKRKKEKRKKKRK